MNERDILKNGNLYLTDGPKKRGGGEGMVSHFFFPEGNIFYKFFMIHFFSVFFNLLLRMLLLLYSDSLIPCFIVPVSLF